MSEKKHRSLKDLFKNSSLLLLKSLGNSLTQQLEHLGQSHRFFLRRRNLKLSITPQSTGSSKPGLANHSPAASDTEESVVSSIDRRGERDKGRHRNHHSHHSLKRFFKILRPEHLDDSGPRELKKPPELPLSLTSELAKKYDMGKLIGTGASGSVNLVTSHDDSHAIYAVKKFRPKLKNETEHDYQTKVKNEFLIGDYLKHQNLIHTMELIKEKTEFLIVMEYCPYDFFNLVMAGLMTEEEIFCYFKQIVNGVAHLHDAGIAHRDLKLDNCVVNADGVLKLIDFGSAFQYRKETKGQTKNLKAKGIVGSDPYLAPEVFHSRTPYDACLTDIWSIAIIFCCLILKRFPWKIPRSSDPSYRSYAGLNSMDEPVSEQELQEHDSKGPKYGPERLMRLLPEHSRPLIAGMLTIDTSKRFRINDVLADSFFQLIKHCHYAEVDELEPSSELVVLSPPPSQEHEIQDGSFKQPLVPMSPSDPASPTPELASPRESSPALLEEAVTHEHEDHRFGSHIHDPEALAGRKTNKRVEKFFKAPNHKHHLVTEQELEKINQERQKAKKLKENGVA